MRTRDYGTAVDDSDFVMQLVAFGQPGVTNMRRDLFPRTGPGLQYAIGIESFNTSQSLKREIQGKKKPRLD